jgi:hypothetical protein
VVSASFFPNPPPSHPFLLQGILMRYRYDSKKKMLYLLSDIYFNDQSLTPIKKKNNSQAPHN